MRRRLISTTRPCVTISLFAEPSIAPRAPSSFVLSMVVHGAIAGMLYFGFANLPRIDDRTLEHFAVRQLDLRALDPEFPEFHGSVESKIPYPGPYRDSQYPPLSPGLVEAMRSFLDSAAGRQTLIQPAFHSHLFFAEPAPLPAVMIWTPELALRRKIVAPLPSPPTASSVKPSLQLPNQEIKLADVAVASIDLTPRSLAIQAGTTSPVETHTAKLVQMAPATLSASADQPTPAALLSISDLRMQDGAMLLPPVNEIGPLPEWKSNAAGTAGASANPGGDGRSARNEAASEEDAEYVSADGRRLTTEHIALSRDGKFSVVVVGTSLAEEYPETIEIWANRVAYTAYLHVGLKKNWILQYSVTRAADTADAGTVTRLEAPWPYDMIRPNLLSRDLTSDALLVHGILNRTGRFESLGIAFPSGFRYASFVLHALRQWQFRPARQNGQATPVEVLLIIPEELE